MLMPCWASEDLVSDSQASKSCYLLTVTEYAAAWFLLAGNLQDAVNICLHQVGDLQLAIAIARIYSGDENPVLQSLIKEKVLPQAANDGNRWQATWAFTMLGQHDLAIQALIVSNAIHPP